MKSKDLSLLVLLCGALTLMSVMYSKYQSQFYRSLVILDIVLVIIELGRLLYGYKFKGSRKV